MPTSCDGGTYQVLEEVRSKGLTPDGRYYRGMLPSRSSVRLRDWQYYHYALTVFIRDYPACMEAKRLIWAIAQVIQGRVEEEAAFRGALKTAEETGQWELLLNPLLHVGVCPSEALIRQTLAGCRSRALSVKLEKMLPSRGSSPSPSSSPRGGGGGSGGVVFEVRRRRDQGVNVKSSCSEFDGRSATAAVGSSSGREYQQEDDIVDGEGAQVVAGSQKY